MDDTNPTVSRKAANAIRPLRVLLAVSVLGPTLLFAGAAWQERRVLMGEAAKRAEKSTEVLEEHAGAAFHSYELVFARVEEHLRAAPNETEAERHAYLAGIDDELKEVDSLFLVDPAGRVTAHSRFYPLKPTDVADRDYFRMLLPKDGPARDSSRDNELGLPTDTGRLAVGKPNVGRLSGTTKLNIARAVTGSDHRFAGAVVISIGQEYFEAFHRKLAASPNDSMALIRTDGVVLARSPSLTGADVERLMDPQTARDMVARLSRGSKLFTSTLDHIERIANYRKLADYPIYVGYGLSTAAVLATWRENLLYYGAAAALAGTALFCVTMLAMRVAKEESRAKAVLVSEMARREAAETALRQAQKMEAVGQLTGGIAHDFNNLLAAVLGNLELLAKRLPDEPRLQRYIQGALEGARRGAGLTQRMLAFARRQELNFESVDIPNLVRGMAELLERSIGPTVAIETRFPVRLPAVRVDANQLEASLLNLAVNARDAMPRGGRIIITGREATAGLGSPLGLAPGPYVVLAVADTGSGMSPDTLARATEPFFTTKPVGKGTGLGLAMVHGLATQSGGTIRIESVLGQGTIVEIWLPVSEATANAPQLSMPRLPERRTRPLHVLLADDDGLVREGTAAMLDDLGHRVTAVASGPDALVALESDEPADVLITDYAMPGMTGIELADRVRAMRPDLPVLLASGYAELSDQDEARLPRLAKPFTQAALDQALSALTVEQARRNVISIGFHEPR